MADEVGDEGAGAAGVLLPDGPGDHRRVQHHARVPNRPTVEEGEEGERGGGAALAGEGGGLPWVRERHHACNREGGSPFTSCKLLNCPNFQNNEGLKKEGGVRRTKNIAEFVLNVLAVYCR